ncbi:MAG: hypothetical protein WA421_13475 [Nitrososphaeraceae archaeon]|jgi:hypothetical protein
MKQNYEHLTFGRYSAQSKSVCLQVDFNFRLTGRLATDLKGLEPDGEKICKNTC